MKPLVSVIVPVYNASEYITEALSSIAQSTYRPLEIVVVDDGSTDDSYRRAEAFAVAHQEMAIHLISQTNAGVSVARNKAINAARGEWILPIDADDKISPTYIEHAVNAIQDNVRLIGCRAWMFGAKNEEWRLPPFSPQLLARRNMIHVSTMFRKADWQQVGGFCEQDIYREDWDFWLSMMELGGEYVRLDEIGLYYRVLPISRRSKAKEHKHAIVDAINARHEQYMRKYLGGPLHYHRSWSKLINFFRSERQVGELNDWSQGKIFYQKRNTLWKKNGIVVKQFAVPSLLRGLIYGLITKSKARRSYEYALMLEGMTPQPIAYREIRYCGILRESWYACQKSQCEFTFNDLINNPNFPNRNQILRAIGTFTARLHQRGIMHRDYSGGNLLFNADGTQIQIIDLNRITVCNHLSRSQRLQNFERLNIDREALRTIAEAYSNEMNEDPQANAEYIITHRWRKHVKSGTTNL